LSWEIDVSDFSLPMLCCGTYVVKQDQLVGPATIEVADGVENTVPDEGREQLLNEESQKTTADDGQVQVVDLERAVQAEGCAVPHELAASQDDGVVRNERQDRLFVRRHDGVAGHELELLGRVAKHLLPRGGEDGPEGDAKGTVESRHTDLEVGEGRHAGGCVNVSVVECGRRPRECLLLRVKSGQREAAGEVLKVFVSRESALSQLHSPLCRSLPSRSSLSKERRKEKDAAEERQDLLTEDTWGVLTRAARMVDFKGHSPMLLAPQAEI
jgi:hypothetical protein